MEKDENWDWSSFWTETISQLKNVLSEQESVMWFSNLEYLSGTEDIMKISVPSSFYKDSIIGVEETCSDCLSGGLVFNDHWALQFLDYKHISKYPIYNLRHYLSMLGVLKNNTPLPVLDIKLSESEISKGKEILDNLTK